MESIGRDFYLVLTSHKQNKENYSKIFYFINLVDQLLKTS